MDEPFELPVNFNGQLFHFPAQLLHAGYSHRFRITVNGTEVLFEPDEERSYRALVDPENIPEKVDVGLLQAIAVAIEKVLE